MTESHLDFLSRSMGQFTSAKTAKVVTQKEIDEKRSKSEWSEQLTLCKWLKHEYPSVLFRSDIQSAGKLSPQMQNIKQIIDPYSGWPDVMIYGLNLAIELKSLTASLSGQHYRDQLQMHERLRLLGWSVHVCRGAEEAKKVFLEYYNK